MKANPMDSNFKTANDFSESEKVGLLKSNSLNDLKKLNILEKKATNTKTNKQIDDIIKFVNNDDAPSVCLQTIEKSLSRAAGQNNNSIKRKQIHFNLAPKLNANAKNPSETNQNIDNKSDNDENKKFSSLHEKLNQIKIGEIKRKKSVPPSVYKKRERNFYFDREQFDLKVRQLKASCYGFYERPVGKLGFFYRIFTFTLILGSIITGTLTTLETLNKSSLKIFFWYEVFATCYFGFEFIIRVWSSGHRNSYKGIEGRIKFMSKLLHVIEIMLIISSIALLIYIGQNFHLIKGKIIFSSIAMTILRFLQIFRFLYIDRRAQTWKLLLKTMQKHRFELLTSVYIGIFILLFSSYFILIFEKNYDSENPGEVWFHSYADAVYWSIITMTTIGYGDRSPRTFYGKIIATCLCIVGVAFWTLPGGIIGSGFALKVEQKNKKKQFNRLLPAAASLIQAWWRMKVTLVLSTSKSSCLAATISTFDLSKPLYSSSLRRLQKHLDPSSCGHNEYFANLDAPPPGTSNHTPFSNEKIKLNTDQPTITNFLDLSFSENDSSILLQLSPEHLILIRTILLLRYWTARHKFKLAFKPYDFKDVIDQYTQGNMDIMLKMKDLQRKLDRVSSFRSSSHPDHYINNSYQDHSFNSSKDSPNGNHTVSKEESSPLVPKRVFTRQISAPGTIPGRSRHLSLSSANKVINLTNNNINNTNERSRHSSLNSNKIGNPAVNEDFNERLNRIEIEVLNISKKLDALIDLSKKNNSNLVK